MFLQTNRNRNRNRSPLPPPSKSSRWDICRQNQDSEFSVSNSHTHTQHKGKNGCNFLGYSRCQLQYTKRIKGSFGWLHLSKKTSKQEVHNSLQLLQETTTFKFSIRTRKERNPISSRPTQASLHHHPIQYPNQRSTPKQAPKQTTQVRLGQSHQVQTLSSQPPAPQTR